MNKKSNVTWVKPAEPTFLKKFKDDVGFQEGPTIDAKRQEMPVLDDDSGSDHEDELPQVVVLNTGDLSADEVKNIKNGTASVTKQEEPAAEGKIMFKKPTNNFSEKFQGITASSNKKRKSRQDKKGKSGKKVKNNSLLSFGGDDEEED
ncbi:uncharacterized protein KIAA1143 homolog isoform X1 [Osmerus mordax]|uniref:uncharacterized protein KIAA1143 homolog isoform X1 n=1 Tax=Osmerus mordax TaxID=8014 RepID=UPI00350FD844